MTEYTLTIDVEKNRIVDCKMNAQNQEAADQIMNDLHLSVAKHNGLKPDALNANLYKTTWVNGI